MLLMDMHGLEQHAAAALVRASETRAGAMAWGHPFPNIRVGSGVLAINVVLTINNYCAVQCLWLHPRNLSYACQEQSFWRTMSEAASLRDRWDMRAIPP